VLKKGESLLYYVKSEFRNRILLIHVNWMVFNCKCCKQEHEDPEIQVELDKGKIVNILYDSGY
jgi:hypothetical protein